MNLTTAIGRLLDMHAPTNRAIAILSLLVTGGGVPDDLLSPSPRGSRNPRGHPETL